MLRLSLFVLAFFAMSYKAQSINKDPMMETNSGLLPGPIFDKDPFIADIRTAPELERKKQPVFDRVNQFNNKLEAGYERKELPTDEMFRVRKYRNPSSLDLEQTLDKEQKYNFKRVETREHMGRLKALIHKFAKWFKLQEVQHKNQRFGNHQHWYVSYGK